MMRRITIFLCSLAVAVSAVMISPVHAEPGQQGQLKPDDLSIYNSISMDCLALKFKLSEVHQQDGLVRVTLGQNYETMQSKLMTPLNARVVENKLDGGQLIKRAAEFGTELDNFKEQYRQYERLMNNLMKIDCQSQMQAYYAELESVRELRVTVHASVQKLNMIIDQYHSDFVEFKKQATKDKKEEVDAQSAE